MARGIGITVIYHATLLLILFSSAGRIDWWRGWIVMGIYIVISICAIILADPELVRERSHAKSGTDRRDVVLASISFLFFYPLTLAVAGIDVGRFGWSPPIPFAIHLAAIILFAVGNALGLWAVVSNRFFSTFMRLQQDRNQIVIREGPYRYVRHPGYAGSILAALALPIALGSLWGLLPALIGACGFLYRTAREDKALREALTGYQEYVDQVRCRIIPGLW